MQGGPVGEFLDVAVERSTFDQLEVEVGRALEDCIRSALAGDHGEEGHLEAVDQAGGHQVAMEFASRADVQAYREYMDQPATRQALASAGVEEHAPMWIGEEIETTSY